MNAAALPEFTPDQRTASNTGAAQARATVELASPGHRWRPPPAGEGEGAQRLRESRHCFQGSSRAGPWITGGRALICSPASTRSYMRR